MDLFQILVSNKIVNVAVLSWFIAQVLKIILVLIFDKKLDFSRIVGSGGMPSSHTAFIIALTTAICKMKGFDSVEFAIAFTMSMIVMVDASGVRRAAGEQAKILNRIVELWWQGDSSHIMEEKLKELLGHSPFEVLVGAILGVAIGLCI